MLFSKMNTDVFLGLLSSYVLSRYLIFFDRREIWSCNFSISRKFIL